MKINVEPSNRLFEELGRNTYDYRDLLSELIDNSLAARIPGETLHVRVEIGVDSLLTPKEFKISDDASGIPSEHLAIAISPAAQQTADSLNEHGLGMKQAVAALGKLESLTTKTADCPVAYSINEFKFGEIEATEMDFDKAHGTTLKIIQPKSVVSTNATHYTRTIIPYLGARYRRFLRTENPILDLELQIFNVNTKDPIYRWPVTEVKPIYFHPNTRENRPVFMKFPLEGEGWKAEVTFGYAPKETGEYEELGLDAPNKFHPYRVSLSTQGLDVILHDRVILFHQLSELGLVSQRHNDFNAVRGEIVLLKGFTTAITKNSMISDAHFTNCIKQVTELLNGERPGPGNRKEDYLVRKSYPEEIPEKLLRDRLIEWLANNPVQKRSAISKEYVLEGIDGYIDVLADGEAWELKRDQASALDVYQLFMYLDIGGFAKGYLVAPAFTTGAEIAARWSNERHGKVIVLAPKDHFPINHPPTTQEREDYY